MNGTLTTGDISGATALGSIAATEKTVFDHIHSWLVTVDHKRLGLMYIIYALVFFVVAGIEASLIRIQLATPNNHFLSPQVFNQLFTMHGTTMVFLVGMPMIFGFANYLVPLMIGARDLAFPRLNAFGFWLSVFGGLLLYFSFIGGEGMTGAGSAPDVGWFAYAPLTGKAFSKGHSTDYWILGIMIGGFGSIATAANIITTILSMRCRGMTLAKMPLLAWLNLIMCGMVLIAVSPLTAAQIMLLLDRFAGSHFFDTQAGGSATLWMHFFWIFGHPEVFAQGHFRLPGHGRCDAGDRLRQPERLGPPHVHYRNDINRKYLFCHFDHDGRYSNGHQNLQLARNHVGWEAAL